MQRTLKRILPPGVRRILRPLAIRYQRVTEGKAQRHLFGNFIAPGDLVFDIGANSGRMTDLFLKLGAHVVAVEPQPKVFEALEAQFAHNKRATLLEAGVSDVAGVETLNICANVDEVSSFDPAWETCHHAARWSGSTQVEMVTLDNLIGEYGAPDYVKIDVEGYEAKVFAGLTTAIPYISFEIHMHHLEEAKKCFNRLATLGNYLFNFAPHEHQSLQIPGWHPIPLLMDWIEAKGWRSGDVFCKLQ